MNSYKIEGVILKRTNFGEAGKLLTIFTRDQGKITVKAVGVRKTLSKRAGSVELFNHIRAVVIKGRGDLDTLAEVQLVNPFSSWRPHIGRVTLAYQLAEVVDKLTPDHQPHPEIFDILVSSLSKLSVLGSDWQLAIGNWQLAILQELGYLEKGQPFKGDIQKLIEETSQRPLNSPKLLAKLK
ncbi:MAG: DNA repair protein RecO [Patescibacteria group bacterium]